MAPNTGAPPTSHLRGRLQKRTFQKSASNQQDAKLPTCSGLENTPFHYWVDMSKQKFTDQEANIATGKTTSSTSNEPDGEVFANPDYSLHKVLDQLADKFEEEGRSYAVLAVKRAQEFSKSDSIQRINPGLWKYIRSIEEEKDGDQSKE